MAKGKSNPKTVERVKGMTKAMRNEMERAEAEAAATEAAARSAKERRKGRRRNDASSEEDEGEGANAEGASSTAAQHRSSKGNKVQIGGFGIGCRGTGNEKARRLKEFGHSRGHAVGHFPTAMWPRGEALWWGKPNGWGLPGCRCQMN